MANKLPSQLPPPQHPQPSTARTARTPRRARDLRNMLQLHRRQLQQSRVRGAGETEGCLETDEDFPCSVRTAEGRVRAQQACIDYLRALVPAAFEFLREAG